MSTPVSFLCLYTFSPSQIPRTQRVTLFCLVVILSTRLFFRLLSLSCSQPPRLRFFILTIREYRDYKDKGDTPCDRDTRDAVRSRDAQEREGKRERVVYI